MSFPYTLGHGTRNDFVVLPDPDGTLHGDLAPELVAALCDRRTGVGADGVLRVLEGDLDGGAQWFMDYRNADGSVSELCGNGLRVFARYLVESGLVDRGELSGPLPIDTRDGVKQVTFCEDGEISVDMGRPTLGGTVQIDVEGRVYDAWAVDMGNPHAVAFVDSLDEVGSLQRAPQFSTADFPTGVNVEFVVRRGPDRLEVRVYERGVGETQSCGTGACAVAVATAVWGGVPSVGAGSSGDVSGPEPAPHVPGPAKSPSGESPGGESLGGESPGGESPVRALRGGGSPDLPTSYAVDVLGGRLTVTWDTNKHVHLKGPAVLVEDGTWDG